MFSSIHANQMENLMPRKYEMFSSEWHPKALLTSLRRIAPRQLVIIHCTCGSRTENVENTKMLIDAAKNMSIQYIMLLSGVKCDQVDTLFNHEYHQIERSLIESGCLHYTIVRVNYLLDNLLDIGFDFRSNTRIAMPTTGYFAPIDSHDIARFVSKVLSNCQPHHGKIYELTGPKTKKLLLLQKRRQRLFVVKSLSKLFR